MMSWLSALKAMFQELLEPQNKLQPIRVEVPKEQHQQRQVQRRCRR